MEAKSQSRPCAIAFETLEPRRMLSSAYTITDLGAATIASSSEFTGTHWLMSINNQGQVEAGGFLYSADGTKTPLTSLARPFRKGVVSSMNDSGQFAGTFDGPRIASTPGVGGFFLFGGTTDHFPLPDGFVYDGKRFRDVGPGEVTSVNASGNAAGLSIRWTNARNYFANGAFVYIAHHRRALKLPPGVSAASITHAAIDASGDVILSADQVYFYPHGPRGLPAAPVQIAPFQFSTAAGNSAGALAGVVTNIDNPGSGPAPHVYVVTPNTTTDLGTIDVQLGFTVEIRGINSSNEVVGVEGVAPSPPTRTVARTVVLDRSAHAVVSHDGAMVDLNTLAPPAETGWTLWSAEGVNDAGQIAACGADATGTPHFLLLTPAGG